MAYLVVYSRGEIVERLPLNGPVIIGRSIDCDVVVHDILLSRKHCQIERGSDGWSVRDLQSKNGTILGHQRVTQQVLGDGDSIRIGRATVAFHAGPMPKERPASPLAVQRPLDPREALSRTVLGMALDSELPEMPDRFALPRPAPPLPPAYEREKIHQMLEEIASSSWDSIYAESRKPTRNHATSASIDRPRKRPARPDNVCMSLQINHDALEAFTHRRRKQTTSIQRVLRTVHKLTPWIALLGILKAA